MESAEDLEAQIIDTELKRDCYTRLMDSAECPELHARYATVVEQLGARLEQLFDRLQAHSQQHAQAKAFDNAQTRVWRWPTAKYRAVS